MNKKISLGLSITILIIAVTITFAITYDIAINNFNKKIMDINERQKMYDKLAAVDQEIRLNFYSKIDDNAITENTIKGYLAALKDPQSAYLQPEEYKKMSEDLLKTNNSDITSSTVGNETGYIKISEFSHGTDERFEKALVELRNKSVKNIVIDLRNNAGGNIESCAKTLDLLLPQGKLISSIDKNKTETVLYNSDSSYNDIPISLVVNSKTEREAELFASAVKDYSRGAIVGVKTAGIVTKSELFPLSDGSAIKISVANYVTKSSGIITGLGISPDMPIDLTDEQKYMFSAGTLSLENDTQIQTAKNQFNISKPES